ncbi:MerR family transcriptional regulator [Ramlibacter sp. WS9]|uniref:adenylate/guanylate cyclase domain-containing protein n=1 Tax=Ramlibacter sp. WS9 TaxID=1882741 RepID=UPI0011430E49|nr:MerR family transcriptional regulator [Ramlibacter sp. WS9]
MYSSKEVLEKTGISRATLNNYISSGIVPRPEVMAPEASDTTARRIGYFPAEVLQRIEEIQRLKREGWNLDRIAEHFGGGVGQNARAPVGAANAARPGSVPALSFDSLDHPAYLLDNRFELVWANERSGTLAWPELAGVAPESRQAILRLHAGLARQRGVGLGDLCSGLAAPDAVVLERFYGEAEPFDYPMVVRTPVVLTLPGGTSPQFLYAISFREGTLFIYLPGGMDAAGLTAMAALPGRAATDAGTGRPVLTQMAVLFAGLQQPARLWAELPPEEYFELVNDIWLQLDPIFERHQGSCGRHPSEGMVCYFLAQPGSSHLSNALAAAWEVRAAMRRVSRQWQSRKGWSTELFMNTGLAQGREWLGHVRPGPQSEMTVMGDAADHAAALSSIACDGAVWATRDLVARLLPEERARLKYGVRRHAAGGDAPVNSVFSRVENLADLDSPAQEALRAVARLPVTEVLDFGPPSDNRK